MINQRMSPIKDIDAVLVAAQIRVTDVTPTNVKGIFVAYEFQWKNPILSRYEWAKLVIWGTDLHEILKTIYRRVRSYREELEDPAAPGHYLYRWAGEE